MRCKITKKTYVLVDFLSKISHTLKKPFDLHVIEQGRKEIRNGQFF